MTTLQIVIYNADLIKGTQPVESTHMLSAKTPIFISVNEFEFRLCKAGQLYKIKYVNSTWAIFNFLTLKR